MLRQPVGGLAQRNLLHFMLKMTLASYAFGQRALHGLSEFAIGSDVSGPVLRKNPLAHVAVE
jgi:hypothetical protein